MAQIATSLTSPELVFAANKAILKAQRSIAQIRKFATDFTADAAQPGSKMMIQFFDDGEAAQYDEETNNYGNANGSTSFIPVTFDNHPKKSFKFGPKDFLAVDGTRFWENSGNAIGRAVSIATLKTVSALITKSRIKTSGTDRNEDADGRVTGTLLDFGAWNEHVVGTGDFDKVKVAKECRVACDNAEIDAGECVLMLNAKAYGELLASLDANLYGGPEAIRHGMIEGLYGFDAVMQNDTLLKTEGLVGAIIPRNAIGVAGRIVPVLNPNLYQEVGTVTDENSGLTMQFRRGGSWETDASVLTGEALFGAQLLQPTKIVRLVTEAQPADSGDGTSGDGTSGDGE